MDFERIDRETWSRKEYFEHYFATIPCTYSITTDIDITDSKKTGQKLYPTMLFALATIVNTHAEFRMAFNAQGELGVYTMLHPSYTVFHKETETFSSLWTKYESNFSAFYRAYEEDIRLYGHRQGLIGKPALPANSFTVSMLPWANFTGFSLHLQKGYDYLLPIFTIGKYKQEQGRFIVPLAIQVHHAVCDGFHVCRFINELQALLKTLTLVAV